MQFAELVADMSVVEGTHVGDLLFLRRVVVRRQDTCRTLFSACLTEHIRDSRFTLTISRREERDADQFIWEKKT